MRTEPRVPAALVALLVLSVVVGAVALTVAAGGATAADDRGVVDAVEAQDGATATETDEDGEDEGDGEDDGDDSETDGDTDDEDDDTEAAGSGAGDGEDDGQGSPLWPWAVLAAVLATGGLLGRRVVAGAGGGSGGGSGSVAGGTVSELLGSAQSAVESAHAGVETARAGLADRFWGLVGLAGYAKWAGDEPLEHDTRATLYERIQSDPGVYLSAVAEDDRLDAGFGTVRYHLKILEREGLIESEKVDGKRRYYPIGAEPDALALAMDEETPAAILETLRQEPKTVSAIADVVDRAPSTVTHHLDSLEADDLVVREREGEAVVNRLAPGVDEEMGVLDAPSDGLASEEAARS